MSSEPEHGTYAGYQRHRRRGEPACDPCKEGNRAYQKARRTTAEGRAAANRHSRATSRALWKLSQAHPEEFAELRRQTLEELALEEQRAAER